MLIFAILHAGHCMRQILCMRWCNSNRHLECVQKNRQNWEVAKRQLDMMEIKRRVLLPAQLGHSPALPDTFPPLLAPWPRLDPCPP